MPSLFLRFFIEPIAKKIEKHTVEQPQMAVIAHHAAWAEYVVRKKALELLYGQSLEKAPAPLGTESVKGAMSFVINSSIFVAGLSAFKWSRNKEKFEQEEKKLEAIQKDMESKFEKVVDSKLPLLKDELIKSYIKFMHEYMQGPTEEPKEPK